MGTPEKTAPAGTWEPEEAGACVGAAEAGNVRTAGSQPQPPAEASSPEKVEQPGPLATDHETGPESPLSLLRAGLRASLGALASPEEEELRRRRQLCAQLEHRLAETEELYKQLQEELRSIQRRYLKIVGPRLVELDEAEAELAEAIARRRPRDQRAQAAARRARRKARNSRAALDATMGLAEPPVPPPRPASLKKLYRDVARRLHPDFSVDERDRRLREWFMAEANRAYQKGDEMKLRALVDDYQCNVETVAAEGPAGELVRAIRRFTWLKRRLNRLDCAIRLMLRSDLYRLRIKIDRSSREGRDFLLEMAVQLDRQIAQIRERLARLQEETLPHRHR
jgi:hypothetical protein